MIKYLCEKIVFLVTIIVLMFVSTSYAGQETCERGESGCICSYTRDGSYVCYKTKIGGSCNPRGTFGSDGQDGEIGIGADTGNIGSSEGCYCDDGPNGRQNCRNYGQEDSGFILAAYAGWEMSPALRVNLTNFVSNTEPNIGEAECWDILNRRGEEFFIPTASQEEWNSFKAKVRNGTLSGIIMNPCPSCGDGVCSNPVTYWGYLEGCGTDDSMTPSIVTGEPMCQSDCGTCPIGCGDGFCVAGVEHCTGGSGGAEYNPCADCGVCRCGDTYFDCDGNCGSCPSCSPCCGDGTCCGNRTCDGADLDTIICAEECPDFCGDHICTRGKENKCTCPDDCSDDDCGDGCCSGAEVCGADDSGPSCSSDCGIC